MNKILGFQDEYRWLSNFHLCTILYEGLKYRSTENAYQASKLGPSKSSITREDFQYITPYQAKRLGKGIHIRPDWVSVRDEIMLELQRIKYQDEELRHFLLATGDAYIEETNYWNDQYWGVCRGLGLNKLGHIIMQVREEIRCQTSKPSNIRTK